MEFQEQIKTLNVYQELKKSILSQNLSQAYLFLCPDSLTNKILMVEFAKLILCEHKNACGVCSNCIKVNAGTHPDLLVYPLAGAFSVMDAKEIYDTVQTKPLFGDYKVYILNNIDVSTEQALNKMLKIIEEPPAGTIFLMSASNPEKILPTIKSRSLILRVDKMKDEVIRSAILENDSNLVDLALQFGEGYIGKTLDVINNPQFVKSYNNMVKLLKEFKSSEQIPFYSVYFSASRLAFEENLIILNDIFRDLLMFKLNKTNLIKNKNLISDFERFCGDYSPMALSEIVKILNLLKQKLDSNVSLTILADNLLFNILEVKYLCK